MRRLMTVLFAATMLVGGALVVEPVIAQMQQSGGGGSTVTANAGTNLNTSLLALDATVAKDATLATIDTDLKANIVLKAGTNVIGHVIVDTVPSTAVTNAGTFAAQAAQAGTWTVQPGNTANTTPWLVKSVPVTPCGTTVFSQALVAVPTSTGSPTSTTTCIMRAYFNNTNASAQTVTLTDNSGTPLNGVGPAFSVPGLSNLVIPYDGVQFTSGIKWVAGGTGITGAIWGFQ